MWQRASSGSSGGSSTPVLLWTNNNPTATFTASYPLADIQATAAADNWGQYDTLLVQSKNFYNSNVGQTIVAVFKGISGGDWSGKVFGNGYNTAFTFNSDGTISASYPAGSGNCPPMKIYGLNTGLTPTTSV